AVPLVAALAAGAPSPSARGLTVAACAAVAAHEPALGLVGRRGLRVRRDHGPRARARLAWLGGVALVAGAAALWLGDAATRLATPVPLLLAGLVALFILHGKEKSALGETVAAVALSSAGLPVALAGGLSPLGAVAGWVAWCLAFTATTFAVREVVAHHKRPAGAAPRPALAAVGPLTACALGIGVGVALGRAELWAAAPVVATSWALWLLRPHPRHLRHVGWALVAASLAAATVLVLVARTAP
ncbi:MAG: YwiC-like family protein, partial [Myxococcales bacterium]|nr:YwiC-like family protein [Myxococcales bacterium]